MELKQHNINLDVITLMYIQKKLQRYLEHKPKTMDIDVYLSTAAAMGNKTGYIIPVVQWVEERVQGWPKFSGNSAYPVPHPSTLAAKRWGMQPEHWLGESAEGIFKFYRKHNKDLCAGSYGNLRLELAQYLLDEATTELKQLVA